MGISQCEIDILRCTLCTPQDHGLLSKAIPNFEGLTVQGTNLAFSECALSTLRGGEDAVMTMEERLKRI